ncbi:MAG: hypothetical protein KA224_08090, partial [Steroidobacteraceae bacterium]|nr:hypothetical protein [Steroidobacteraceae bacterium]
MTTSRPSLPDAAALEDLLLTDRRRLERARDRIVERVERRQPFDRELGRLRSDYDAACARYASRRDSVPAIRYPEELPVSQRIDEIREAILQHQVVVICGETGSGKTTQLPKACLEVVRGLRGLIGHTQPRRIAARTVA